MPQKLYRKIYHKNCQILAQEHPDWLIRAENADTTGMELTPATSGELTLLRTYEGVTYSYHSLSSPSEEAKDWFAQLPLTKETDTLFVYGMGLGYAFGAAKAWLESDPKRAFLFLEQDPAVLHIFLHTPLAQEILQHPQVRLIFFDTGEKGTCLEELSWQRHASHPLFAELPLYAQLNPKGTQQLKEQLLHAISEKNAYIGEYLDFGIPFFRNFYPNLFALPESFLASNLFGKFAGVPAIICGAGPSLSKSLPDLEKMHSHALLFAGGSALNALIEKNLLPHFAAAIDPNTAQISRVQATKPHPIPFFYRSRLNEKALQAISGKKIYVPGSGGYDIASWMEEQLGIPSQDPLDEGHNVVNFLVSIAHALGCSPLILVGVDLALTNGQYYAQEVATNLQLPTNSLEIDPRAQEELIWRHDASGHPIQTLWKWQIEADWISRFAIEHPETTILNASQGGLLINHIEQISLLTVLKKHPTSSTPFQKQIEQLLSHQPRIATTKNAKCHVLTTLTESLLPCEKLISQLLQEYEQIARCVEQHLPYPESLETPSTRLLSAELEQQPAFSAILEKFLQIAIRKDALLLEALQSPRCPSKQKQQDLQRLRIHQNHLSFLKDTLRINLKLIKY